MIKLASPDLGQEELDEVKKVLDSGILVQGDRVEELEKRIAAYVGVKHAIAVSSGTAALHLALLALDILPGDEVLVPDLTFPATANVVELAGAITKPVDIDIDSFCMDVSKIEKYITAKTKFIIPVHEFGQSADMDTIIDIANRYGIRVIEDAACALGTLYKGRMVGSIGDIGCFSLHPRKAITTGEGGIVTTNMDAVADKVRLLRNHGLSYINGKAQFIAPGYNYRLTNIQGAIGVVQMNKLQTIIDARVRLAGLYDSLLRNIRNIVIPAAYDYGKHVYQTYHILIGEKVDRDNLIVRLRQKGIETNLGAYSVHVQPYYQNKYNYDSLHYPNSLMAYTRGLALPLYPSLQEKQIEYIASCLDEALKETV